VKLIADTQKIIEQFIQTRVNDAGAKGVVLGLSGGIDSAVTLNQNQLPLL
jgi:NH3-dependent NAD+ synthetase